jgi:hypothetical protein
VNAKKLGGGVFTMPPAGAARRPAFVDKIVRDKRIHKLEQGNRTGRWKIGIHGNQTTLGNPTRQRE